MQRGNETTHAAGNPQILLSLAADSSLVPSPSGVSPLVSLTPVPKGACQSQAKPPLEQGPRSRWTVERSEGLAGKKPGQQG